MLKPLPVLLSLPARALFLRGSALLMMMVFSLICQAVDIQGGHFVNEQGAKIIFRGYNIQTKGPPFQPIQSAEELDPLARTGANLIRFNFIWEAAEPEPGEYDESYFEYYDRVVNWAWERGMYVLIDFHNNAFSRYAAGGCGSGFPYWAISPEVNINEPKANGECSFNTAMVTAMLSSKNYQIWQDFMTDAYGARTRFFALTERLARHYADHPAVIGFDLNEPMVFKPGLQYDNELANSFFNAWQEHIQSVNPKYITFFGDSPFQFIFINQPPHLDIPEQGKVALDAHFYEIGAQALGFPLLGTAHNVRAMVQSREELGIPVLVGEYGVNLSGGGKEVFQYQMDMVLRQYDQALLSSTRWNYTPHWNPEQLDHFHDEDYSCFDENNQLRETCNPRLHLQQLSGELETLHIQHRGEAKFFYTYAPFLSDWFQYRKNKLELRWQHQPGQGGTKIFAAKALFFPQQNVEIKVEGNGLACAYDERERFIWCDSEQAGMMSVTIGES